METTQPTLKNGRNIWDKINMPEEEFLRRIKNIRKEMKREGIRVLCLYGYGLNEYGNYCYLSNFLIRLPRGALLILPLKEEPCLIFEGASRGIPSFKKTTWVNDLRASADVSKEVVKYLKEKNLIPSTIGFAGVFEFMPYEQVRFLSESLAQCKIIDADYIVKRFRMVKSLKEVDEIRRSSRIVRMLFNFITETKFLLLNERMLEAIIYREARFEGAEDIRIMIGKPKEEGWAFRPMEAKEFSSNETIILNISVEFERYWAEATRTFVFKDNFLSETKSEDFIFLYQKIVKKLKPGEKISKFYDESIIEIEKHNFSYIQEYGMGNGVGLSPNEPPIIGREEKENFKDGMTFSLNLLVKDYGIGARMLGNTIHLTKKGAEILT